MICPDCGFDNIEGEDLCNACGQPLIDVGSSGNELEESISRHNVEVLMNKSPVSVPSSTSVRDAVGEMVNRKLGCLLILDNGELVGIFTERDLLNKVSVDLANLNRPVADFMTGSLETVTKQDSIAYAMHAMDLGGYRHLPIVDEKSKPIGIISIRDILRFLCIRFAQLRTGAN